MSMIEQLSINTAVVSTRLQYKQVEKGIAAFKIASTVETVKSVGELKVNLASLIPTAETSGYVDDRNLKLLRQGKPYQTLQFWRLDASTRELIRTGGWQAWEKAGYVKSKDVFEAVADPDCLVKVDTGSHMLFDRYGAALPVGINFDYISHGGITEGRYDLKKLAAHLLSRDDVQIFPRKEGWRTDQCDKEGRATQVDQCITNIPYYNSERGASQTIYFRWAPTKEVYQRMWAHCLKKKKQYPSTYMHQAIFELDLLGVRACGAALFDDYHKSTRYNSREDDYEHDED
jgi:hypothetical protein